MIVNHRVVVTQEQLNMLALEAPTTHGNSWAYDEAVAGLFTGLPVVLAPDDGTPVDCGDGWLAAYRDDTLYAWNDAQIKADLERLARESSMRSLVDQGFDQRSVGLFQQSSSGWRPFS